MEKQQESIAQRIRMAMDAKGIKQADLMRKSGLDRGAISSYLSGKYEPKQKAIYKLSQALDVSEAWLLGYDVPMARTDDQKKNDQLVKLVAKLRADEAFYNTVVALAELDESQHEAIRQLVATLKK